MTRDEILALSAEDLRVEIAKAKGWIYFEKHGVSPEWWGLPIGNHQYKWCYLKDWPTSISDAWELVEEVKQYDDCWLIVTTDGNHNYICSIQRSTGGDETQEIAEYCAEEITASLAISRAWLFWKLDLEI